MDREHKAFFTKQKWHANTTIIGNIQNSHFALFMDSLFYDDTNSCAAGWFKQRILGSPTQS